MASQLIIVDSLASEAAIHFSISILVTTGTASRGAGPRLTIVGERNRVRVNGACSNDENCRELAGYPKAGTIGYGLTVHPADDVADGILDLNGELVCAADSIFVLLVLSDVDAALPA